MSGSLIYSFNGYLLFGSLNPIAPEPDALLSSDGPGVEPEPSGGGSAIGGAASFSEPLLPTAP